MRVYEVSQWLQGVSLKPGLGDYLRKCRTPCLVMDEEVVRRRFELMRGALDGVEVFYAMKANSSPVVVNLIEKLGSGFEISTERELVCLSDGVFSKGQVICSNPVKTASFIEKAVERGVRHFAFDTVEELGKLANSSKECKPYVRLDVPNSGSQWPLGRKFGVSPRKAVEFLERAGELGVVPFGLTFHVGSQCTAPTTYRQALKTASKVWHEVSKKGIELEMLNIGGGFPIKHSGSEPGIEEIAEVVLEGIRELFPAGIRLWCEPGRALVGEAGVLVSTVIGKGIRRGKNWLHLDVGIFNGLMEALGGISYQFFTNGSGELKRWSIVGPSCDSFDVVAEDVELPEPEVGDRVFIYPAGAYTVAYASEFNGCVIPEVYLI